MRGAFAVIPLFLIFLFTCDTLKAGTTTVIDGTTVDNGNSTYYLGDGSSFNLLIVTNDGVLKNGSADFGELSEDQANEAIVTGTNSLWSCNGSMYLGISGPNNFLTVAKGGTVSVAGPITLGSSASSTGNALNIIDGGNVFASTLEARRGSILLSNAVLGVSSLLANTNGSTFFFDCGALSTTNGVKVGSTTNPFVVGTVVGGTSSWNILGGNSLVASTNGFILGDADGTTNVITVSGLGTTLNPTGPLYLGNNGVSSGRSSILLAPGTILAEDNIIGALDGSGCITNVGGAFQFTTPTPLITNAAAGSIFGSNVTIIFHNVASAPVSLHSGTLTNLLLVGGTTLRLDNSTSEVAPETVFRSFDSTNYCRLELVDGTNQWIGTNLMIGPGGSMLVSNCSPVILPNGGFLTIADAASVVYDGDRNNFNSANSNLTVVVSGTNAQWYNQRFFTFGSSGGNNAFIVTNGASLITTNNDAPSLNPYNYDFSMGYNASSFANKITVAGPGSFWDNAGEVDIGVSGAGNEAYVLEGASAIGVFVLGSASNESSNNTMLVSGEGSTLAGTMTVGKSGIQNRFDICDGANAQLGGIMIGYLTGATNNTVRIHEASVTADTVNIGLYGKGDLTLDRGTLTVNWLYQSGGNFNFNSGIVNAYFSQVNFIVGNGIEPARLNLTGSFHHGTITVSSNAWLTGMAAYVTTGRGVAGIENNVTNYGTISPGNPVGEMSILYANLSLEPFSTAIFNIQGTNQGISYSDLLVTDAVQFGGNLVVRLVSGFRPSSNDVFTLMTFGSSSGAFANAFNGSRIKTTDGLGSFQVNYSATALTLSDYQTTDADGDGIDDDWAIQYFGHTPLSSAEKQADADGDGLSNYEEYLAGTDPKDPKSAFKVTSLTADLTGAATLQFKGAVDKTYRIAFSDDLVSWNLVDMPLLAWIAPGTYQWIDDGTETGSRPKGERYYRIIVTP